MRFLHCSDVHITHDYFRSPLGPLGWRRWLALLELGLGRAREYAHAHHTLEQITRDVERHRVDHLILSGDVTAYAMDSEFERARVALGALAHDRQRLTIVPGNHDVFTPRAASSRRFERHFGHLLHSDLPEHQREGPFPFVRLLGEEAAVVGLSSARLPRFPGLAWGYLGTDQLVGLEGVLADRRLQHRAVLVTLHHAPLNRRGKKDQPLHGLHDMESLFRMVRGPRFAVLHGHIHERYRHEATAHRPHTFGAGSSTQRGREGYWVIEVKDGKVVGANAHQPGATAHGRKAA